MKPKDVAAAAAGDPILAVPRYVELRDRLLPEHRGALEGYVRAAAHPSAVVAGILAEGPDTGTQAQPGVTWRHVGQGLLELQAAGKPFSAALFRGFLASLVLQERRGPRTDETPSERLTRRADELDRAAKAGAT